MQLQCCSWPSPTPRPLSAAKGRDEGHHGRVTPLAKRCALDRNIYSAKFKTPKEKQPHATRLCKGCAHVRLIRSDRGSPLGQNLPAQFERPEESPSPAARTLRFGSTLAKTAGLPKPVVTPEPGCPACHAATFLLVGHSNLIGNRLCESIPHFVDYGRAPKSQHVVAREQSTRNKRVVAVCDGG